MSSRVSVALATFNGEQYLLEQLQSFVRQTRWPDEVIIVDDCSADSTLSIARSFAETAQFDVRVFANESNLGYAQNFSRALELCTGDLVFISDQDDVWLPNKIERVVKFFETNPQIQLVIHDLEYCNKDLIPIGQTKIERMQGVFDLDCDYVVGMATAIRGPLLKLCLPIPNISGITHDSWLHSCANAIEKKYILHEVLAMYRRHASNLTRKFNLNVDFVTTSDHFKSCKQPIFELVINKTVLSAVQISPLCQWLQTNLSVLVDKGLSTAVHIEKLIDEEMKRVESVAARTEILSMGWARRFFAVISLFHRGGYRYFSGWKSAVKDLLLN